ncbi:MAG: 16S rRNA (uracil(1498)-N(3))-methyltransferase [Sulfurovum sp.]|nr:MAG: 16S rRNA (uracil(1498)-N(3))-methyltransferase [Sulfurovum sp.]
MLYLYHEDAGQETLKLEGEAHRYLFKVRRHKAGDRLHLRNLQDNRIYRYEISQIDKRTALLTLEESEILEIKASKKLHIGWCVIDPKSIEKALPSLNEMGVEKITFIYCDRSQKSFKPDLQRLRKILLGSSQQSGRSEMMQLETAENLDVFLRNNPDAKMLNFSKEYFVGKAEIETIVIGCEGGFTPRETALFAPDRIVGFQTPLVLKSESAACAVAAKVLL